MASQFDELRYVVRQYGAKSLGLDENALCRLVEQNRNLLLVVDSRGDWASGDDGERLFCYGDYSVWRVVADKDLLIEWISDRSVLAVHLCGWLKPTTLSAVVSRVASRQLRLTR